MEPIRIGFNISPLKGGHKTRGIGAYTKNLLFSLKKRPDLKIIEFDETLNRGEVDLIHYPSFDLFKRSLAIKQNYPVVVTIHDVTPLVFPQNYPPGIKGSLNHFWQKVALKNIKAIITDSQSSKKDIIKYLGVNAAKVFPIYLAPGEAFKPVKDNKLLEQIKEKYELPQEFVLYTGNVNWNKNLVNLAQACKKVGVDLVLVGSGFKQKENLDHSELRSYKEFLDKFNHDPLIHILGYIEENDLVCFMNLASAVMLPSFYEGFGLPILEGQACRTPVITGNTSSMPEVAGDGAILVDPYSVNGIGGAIKEIINDKEKRKDLIEKGFENVKKFSWEKTVNQTTEIYIKVIRR